MGKSRHCLTVETVCNTLVDTLADTLRDNKAKTPLDTVALTLAEVEAGILLNILKAM